MDHSYLQWHPACETCPNPEKCFKDYRKEPIEKTCAPIRTFLEEKRERKAGSAN